MRTNASSLVGEVAEADPAGSWGDQQLQGLGGAIFKRRDRERTCVRCAASKRLAYDIGEQTVPHLDTWEEAHSSVSLGQSSNAPA